MTVLPSGCSARRSGQPLRDSPATLQQRHDAESAEKRPKKVHGFQSLSWNSLSDVTCCALKHWMLQFGETSVRLPQRHSVIASDNFCTELK